MTSTSCHRTTFRRARAASPRCAIGLNLVPQLLPYKTAERRELVDKGKVVLIRLNPNPRNQKPNEFASHVFKSPSGNAERSPIVGDVLAVREDALAPAVKEHLGLERAKRPVNIRLRILDHALLLARVRCLARSVPALTVYPLSRKHGCCLRWRRK